MLFPGKYNSRTQDLKKTYHDAGQFYWGHESSWTKKKNIFRSKVDVVEIPRWRAQDINFIDDWITAEKLFKLKKNVKK